MTTQAATLLTESEQTIVDDAHPWPGLASFREQDEHYFKGRGADIEKLRMLVDRERLTVLFGVSGLGKSSLLQAGLFPRLRLENIFPVYIRLDFTGTAVNLSQQIFSAIFRQANDRAVEVPARTGNETLWEYFHRKGAEFWDDRNRIVVPLLCFDQFEEIFTLGAETPRRVNEVRQVLDELAELVEGRCPEAVRARLDENPDEANHFHFSRHPYKIILSLREDYLADLEGLRKKMPSIIHNRMRLSPMSGEQALSVADQTQGRLMETRVAESIVRLVAGRQGEEELPLARLRIEPALLSLVCRELNEKRIASHASQIDAQSVESNREQILGNFYERSLKDQPPELRRFIEDKLITVNGFRNSEAFDNAQGTPGITKEALFRLVQSRLLRLEERDGIRRIELIHDVLTGVVRKSRDQRWMLEKQQQVEAERAKIEEAYRASKRKAVIYLSMLAVMLCTAIWAGWNWWDAKQARIKAQEALITVNRTLAMSHFREANHRIQNDDRSAALSYLARALSLYPEWLSSRSLLLNLLQQRNWFLPETIILKHEKTVTSASFSSDGLRVVTASNNTMQLWDAMTGQLVGEPIRHAGYDFSAKFSPDGTRIVTASEDKTARLWNAYTGEPVGKPMEHGKPVNSAKFSPDGTRVMTVSNYRTVRLWDAQTGKSVGELAVHNKSNGFESASFSPDGTRVVTTSADTAQLWDAKTAQSMGEPMQRDGEVESADFSLDGRHIVTTSKDKTVWLWDAQTGKPVGELSVHKSIYLESVNLSPDGTRIVMALNDETVQLWDVHIRKPVGKPIEHDNPVTSVNFSPDGTRIVTVSNDKTARLWDAMTGQSLGEPMKHDDAVRSANFSPDGTRVLTRLWNTVQLWNAMTGRSLGKPMNHKLRINSASFSPDSAYVMTTSADTAQLWDAKTAHSMGEPMKLGRGVNSANFSSNGTRIVIASDDRTVQLWDVHIGKPVGELMEYKGDVRSASFSSEGARIVIALDDKTVQLWDVHIGKPVGKLMEHDGTVESASFSPDGTRVVTTSAGTVQLWDAHTGKPVGKLMEHDGTAESASFSPDGTRVVTTSADTVQLWDAKTGQAVGEPIRHWGYAHSVHFSPDGRHIVTTSKDKTVWLWDAHTGKPVGELSSHRDNYLNSVNFSPDGTRIVTISYDKKAWLWNTMTGQLVCEPMTHKEGIRSASFSPDGTRVVTTSAGTVQLWDAKTGQPLGEPMEHRGNVESANFSPDGTRILTKSRNIAQLWDTHTGKLVGELMEHEGYGYVRSANFSPDGLHVVTSGKTLRLWDAKTGQPLGEPMKHDGARSVNFSPDSTRIVTVSDDNVAKLWDAKTSQPLGEPMQHEDIVFSASFSPDGTRVVTTSAGTVQLWDAKTGQPLGEPMEHRGNVESANFSPDGTRIMTGSKDSMVRLWDVLPVLSGEHQLLATLAEAVSGQKLNENDAMEALEDPAEQLNQLRRQTDKAPLGESTAESFVRWFLSDPWTRTISPLSRLTVPEYIQQQLAAGRRQQVEEQFPGHPLLQQEKPADNLSSALPVPVSNQPVIPVPAVKPPLLRQTQSGEVLH